MVKMRNFSALSTHINSLITKNYYNFKMTTLKIGVVNIMLLKLIDKEVKIHVINFFKTSRIEKKIAFNIILNKCKT